MNLNNQDQESKVQAGVQQFANAEGNPALARQKPLMKRIHADDQDKRSMCLFWGLFLVIMIIIAIVGNLGLPSTYRVNQKLRISNSAQPCLNPILMFNSTTPICNNNFSSAQLVLGDILANIQPANQFGLVYLNLIPTNLNASFNINDQITITLSEVNINVENHILSITPISNISSINDTLIVDSSTADELDDDLRGQKIGYQIEIATINHLDGTSLLVTVQFNGNQLSNFSGFSNVYLQTQMINEQFTYFSIIIRAVFFLLAIIAAGLYIWRFLRIPTGQKIIEQKFIAVLSILLIMFNDPFYAITILKPNGASSFFSILFIINIVAFIFLKWITIIDRIHFEDGIKESNMLSKKKIIYSIIIWIQLIVLYMLYAMFQINNTPLLTSDDFDRFIVPGIIVGVTVAIGLVYILFRYIKICMSEGSKLWRNQMYMLFSLFFIFAMCVFLLTDSFTIFNYSGQRILLVYTVFNIYVYYLQYMYTITREQNNVLKRGLDGQHQSMTVGTIDMVDVNMHEDPSQSQNNWQIKSKHQQLVENSEIQPDIQSEIKNEKHENAYDIQ